MTEASPPPTVRVFVDGHPVNVAAGTSARHALAVHDGALAARLDAGELSLTDARALPLPPDTPLTPGAILRVVRARPAGEPDADG